MTTPLFTKLNLKAHHASIVVLHAPPEFEPELAALPGSVKVHRKPQPAIEFVLAFVKTRSELSAAARAFLSRLAGDAVVWFAYPKASSKRLRSELTRDSAWEPLGEAGYEGVRQVSIDADWSALRFRHVRFIKAMTRHPAGAISAAGKAKTSRAAAAALKDGGEKGGEGGCPPKTKKQRLS